MLVSYDSAEHATSMTLFLSYVTLDRLYVTRTNHKQPVITTQEKRVQITWVQNTRKASTEEKHTARKQAQ